ncbi:MAG: hypothetical protein ABMB14_38635, partial [Myxococcota bacterium]
MTVRRLGPRLARTAFRSDLVPRRVFGVGACGCDPGSNAGMVAAGCGCQGEDSTDAMASVDYG